MENNENKEMTDEEILKDFEDERTLITDHLTLEQIRLRTNVILT